MEKFMIIVKICGLFCLGKLKKKKNDKSRERLEETFNIIFNAFI